MPKQVVIVLLVVLLLAGVVLASVPVDAHTPVFMTVAGQTVKVAETWSEVTIHFTDGSQKTVSSGRRNVVTQLISLFAYTVAPKTIDADVKAVNVPNVSLEKGCYKAGVVLCPVNLALVVQTNARILVNGVVKYQSPSNGEKVYWAGINPGNRLQELTGLILVAEGVVDYFQPGQMAIPISIKDWDSSNYISETDKTTISFIFEQEWKLYYVYQWRAGAWVLGSVNAAGNDLAQGQPVYATVVGKDPVEIQYQPQGPTPEPDFGLGVSPVTTDIARSGSGNRRTFYVVVDAINGFNSPVQLTTTNIPTGLQASFNPSSGTPSNQLRSVLTVTASSSAQLGTYTIIVKADGGGISKTVTVTLNVKDEALPDETEMTMVTSIGLDTDQINYNPGDSIKISGKLADANGHGLENMQVSLTSDFDFSDDLTTNSQGRFAAEATAPNEQGIYHLTAKFFARGDYRSCEQTARFSVDEQAHDYCSIPIIGPLLCGADLCELYPNIPSWLCGEWLGIPIIILAAIGVIIVLWLLLRPKK